MDRNIYIWSDSKLAKTYSKNRLFTWQRSQNAPQQVTKYINFFSAGEGGRGDRYLFRRFFEVYKLARKDGGYPIVNIASRKLHSSNFNLFGIQNFEWTDTSHAHISDAKISRQRKYELFTNTSHMLIKFSKCRTKSELGIKHK